MQAFWRPTNSVLRKNMAFSAPAAKRREPTNPSHKMSTESLGFPRKTWPLKLERSIVISLRNKVRFGGAEERKRASVDTQWVESMVTFRLRHTAVEVSDLDRSLQFYTEVLGMRVRSHKKVTETNGKMAVLESEGSDHRLEVNHYNGHAYSAGDQLDHIAFEVENLDETLEELKAEGIEPVSYLRQAENARWTYIADPDGIWIEIYQIEP